MKKKAKNLTSTNRRRCYPSPNARAQPPALRFSPSAWAKLLFLRDCGETEVGGFGISAEEDPLLVEDVRLVRQRCTWASVSFDDESVADYFDEQVDAGLPPQRFSRIWIHTHPGDSPLPSSTDEATFARVFGTSDWSVMFIVARGGQTYARIRFSVGPSGECVIPVDVDYAESFAGSDHEGWLAEYEANVINEERVPSAATPHEDASLDVPFWTEDDLPVMPDVFDEWPQAWLENEEQNDERECRWLTT